MEFMSELTLPRTPLKIITRQLKNNDHFLAPGAADASACGLGFQVSLRTAHLPAKGEALFSPDSYILSLILKKHGEINTCPFPGDGDSFEPQAAQGVHFIPPNHSVLTRWNHGGYRALFLEFDFEKLFKNTIDSPLWRDIKLSPTVNLKCPRLIMSMRSIAEELSAPGSYSALKIDLYVRVIALELLDYFSELYPPTNVESRGLSAIEVRRLHQYVDSADAIPSQHQMAAECGINTRLLASRYREACGMTLRSYISAVKIQRAQEQLLKQDVMIKQIAYQSGFASSAAFSRAFHKATGMTPLEYSSYLPWQVVLLLIVFSTAGYTRFGTIRKIPSVYSARLGNPTVSCLTTTNGKRCLTRMSNSPSSSRPLTRFVQDTSINSLDYVLAYFFAFALHLH